MQNEWGKIFKIVQQGTNCTAEAVTNMLIILGSFSIKYTKGGREGVHLSLSNLFDIYSQFFVVEKVGSYFSVGKELLYLSDVELSHSITEWWKKYMGI
jgi:hypothetical protein